MVQPRILIVGAGAVGLVWAYRLSKLTKNRPSISIIARSNYQALKDKGVLTVKYRDDATMGGEVKPDILLSSYDLNGPSDIYDFIVVTTKTTDNKAVEGLGRFMGSDTVLVLAQNGIGIEDPYIEAYGSQVKAIATSVMFVYSHMTGPISAELSHPDILCTCGVVYGDDDCNLADLGSMALEAGFKKCDVIDRYAHKKARWEKTLWNGVFNTICAVTGLGVPELFLVENMEEAIKSCVSEIYLIAKADLEGHEWVDESKIQQVVDYCKYSYPKGNVPSTLQDVRNGKDIEVVSLNTNLIKTADRLGVPVPTLRFLNPFLGATNLRLQLNRKCN